MILTKYQQQILSCVTETLAEDGHKALANLLAFMVNDLFVESKSTTKIREQLDRLDPANKPTTKTIEQTHTLTKGQLDNIDSENMLRTINEKVTESFNAEPDVAMPISEPISLTEPLITPTPISGKIPISKPKIKPSREDKAALAKRLYEHTNLAIGAICAEAGCSYNYLYVVVKRHGWKRLEGVRGFTKIEFVADPPMPKAVAELSERVDLTTAIPPGHQPVTTEKPEEPVIALCFKHVSPQNHMTAIRLIGDLRSPQDLLATIYDVKSLDEAEQLAKWSKPYIKYLASINMHKRNNYKAIMLGILTREFDIERKKASKLR